MLYRGARILIMDEPTAVLAPQEIDELFRTLRSMTADGRSVVFISHKLGEVLAIADRITVMRRGKRDRGRDSTRRPTPRPDLARRMVGRPVLEVLERAAVEPGRGRPGGRATSPPRTTAACPRCEACRSTSTPARSSGSPRSRATARPSWPRPSPGSRPCTGRVTIDGDGGREPPGRRRDPGRASRTCPRTGPASGARPNLSIADNLIMKRYRQRRSPAAGSSTTPRRADLAQA